MKPRQRRKSGGRPTVGGLEPSPASVCRESSRPIGARPVRLILPLAPSPNTVLGWGAGKVIRAKLAYKRGAWIEACRSPNPPLFPESIPRRCRIHAVLFVKQLTDEDALAGRLKWTIDMLKWKQQGPAEWKQGIMDERAYIYDDSPAHLTVGRPTQHIDRKRPRVEITITVLDD